MRPGERRRMSPALYCNCAGWRSKAPLDPVTVSTLALVEETLDSERGELCGPGYAHLGARDPTFRACE